MSDYKVQVNFSPNGDFLFNVNGLTVDELAGFLADMSKQAPDMFTSLSEIKQAGLAAEVFMMNTGRPNPSTEATDSLPGEVRCTHGPMKDLQGKTNAQGQAYKYRYYCPAERTDPTKCKEGKN